MPVFMRITNGNEKSFGVVRYGNYKWNVKNVWRGEILNLQMELKKIYHNKITNGI